MFWYPLRELAEPKNRLLVGFGPWHGPAFYANDYLVWGFTAGILATILEHAGWERTWDNNSVHDLHGALSRSRNNEKMF